MQDVKLPEGFGWENVVFVVAFLVALSGVLVALVKGYEAWKKISVRDRVRRLEVEMVNVQKRLKLGDKRFQLQSDDSGQILATMQALLLHFLTGNSNEKLREQLQTVTNYINTRATRQTEIEEGEEHEN